MPPGSTRSGFSYTPGEPFGEYTFTGDGASGFMACPVEKKDGRAWQVFAATEDAKVPSGDVKDCLGFDAMAVAYDGGFGAWEYV